ncbi:membrane-bound lytic murein transglycosylase B [Nitrosomonas sp. PY1]|uniref:lytic murein transglycosylase n=1 Tax=Nitrosomonas sp. PY1 TaxID=1803906 RepID=UPI001FC8DB98|nr:lytic murein transglycosylase [Nitrosomonas sp. PY1]GKS69171.1 membrane-bound lytic murein transglycosylase B [Nitrosomonas sp. PY1]
MNDKIRSLTERIGKNALNATLLLSFEIMAQSTVLESSLTKDFDTCVARIAERAKMEGISNQTVSQTLSRAKQIPKIIELDRRQPEFSQTFANYFNVRINEERVQRGRELLNRHRTLLNQIQKETGVPGHYLVSFWGLETSYGSHFGDWKITDSLATLACDSRRGTFFTQELINAMRIIDAGDIIPERMIGSWAGAMGHMQFMPSTFLHYAKDMDGDGRRDLWGSIPDAFGSAANFLRQMGWVPGLEWGQEVRLPEVFDYTLSGRGQMLSQSEWAKLGVLTASGAPLPLNEQKSALLIPSGYQGPAFLVTRNFQVIMRWNRSEYYAISVGHLADRISGGGALHRPPISDSIKITREQIRQLQKDLLTLGIDAGEIDGVLGSTTRQAISHFQQHTQRIADGYLDHKLLIAIRQAAQSKSSLSNN